MLTSQHVVVGSAVAVATGNPVLGFVAGVITHHILDSIPHLDVPLEKNDDGTYTKHSTDENYPWWTYLIAVSDGILAIAIVILLIWRFDHTSLILAGSFGSVLPDILDVTPWWKDKFRKTTIGKWWHTLHSRFDYQWKNARMWQLILASGLQFSITVGGTIWFLLKF